MKSFLKMAKVGFMVMVCALFLGIGMKAEAAPGAVTNLRQIKHDVDAVQIEWAAPQGDVAKYKVEFCDNSGFEGSSYMEGETGSQGVIIPRLKAGSSYYFRVAAIDSTGAEGATSAPIEVVTAPAKTMKVSGLKQTNATEKGITMSWNQFAGANLYVAQYRIYGTQTLKDVETTGNSATISSLTVDTPYVVTVFPARRSSAGYTAYGDAGSASSSVLACTLPKKVTNVKFNFGGKGNKSAGTYADFSWKYNGKVANGFEYTVYGNNGKKLFSGTETKTLGTTVRNKKLKNTQFMKIRVRAYVNVDGKKKYGPYSDECWFARFPNIKVKLVNKYRAEDGVQFSWNKVQGAKNYTVYVSTSSSRGYKKVATTSKTSLTVKKFGNSQFRSGGKYYYRVVANSKKKVGKKQKAVKGDSKQFGGFNITTSYGW